MNVKSSSSVEKNKKREISRLTMIPLTLTAFWIFYKFVGTAPANHTYYYHSYVLIGCLLALSISLLMFKETGEARRMDRLPIFLSLAAASIAAILFSSVKAFQDFGVQSRNHNMIEEMLVLKRGLENYSDYNEGVYPILNDIKGRSKVCKPDSMEALRECLRASGMLPKDYVPYDKEHAISYCIDKKGRDFSLSFSLVGDFRDERVENAVKRGQFSLVDSRIVNVSRHGLMASLPTAEMECLRY